MKLCVVGAEGTGKTTLLQAIKRGWLKSRFTLENQSDKPTCATERTVGINVTTVDIPGVGLLSLFDYAGQKQFHKTHGLFFSTINSLFILLISLLTEKEGERRCRSSEELVEEAHYWLAFLRSSIGEEFTPTVIIAVSRADYFPNCQDLIEDFVGHIRNVFIGKVIIREEYFLLDCRKSWSRGMRQLRQILKKTREEYIQCGIRYPNLCEPVTNKLLPDLRDKQNEPFMETDKLVREIESKCCSGQDRAVINKVVNFLDETGEIIRVDDIVSLSPCWLSEYAFGPLIAPSNLKWYAKAPDGIMTKEAAEKAVNRYLRDKKISFQINIDHILKMMINIGVSFKLEDDSYMFPTHLPPKQLSDVWKNEEKMQIYVGRRYICFGLTTIFSPSTFTLFQCQICVKHDTKSLLWRDGLIVARAGKSLVQCLVVMVDSLRAVDFVARGESGSESECLSILEDVMREWTDMVEKHSPATDYTMEYLSTKQLKEHRNKPVSYSQEVVKAASINGPLACVAHNIEISDSLKDLLAISPDRLGPCTRSKAIQSVIDHGCSQWYAIGLELGFSDSQINQYCNDQPEHSGKLLVLLEKKLQVEGMERLEKLALDACWRIPQPIDGIVRDEIEASANESTDNEYEITKL
jgi:death-associated protein kinase